MALDYFVRKDANGNADWMHEKALLDPVQA